MGLAMIERDRDVADDDIRPTAAWELDIVRRRYPVTLSLAPLYDPARARIKA